MNILTVFYRLFAVLMTLFVFTPTKVAQKYTIDTNANMTAVIISDVHMETNNYDRFRTEGKAFAGIASANKYPDALIMCGDNTMNGQTTEINLLYGFLQRNKLLTETQLIMAQGNHDFGNSDSAQDYEKLSARAISNYNRFTGRNIDKVYYSTDVNGYKVLVLASEKNMENTISYVSEEQVEWLRAELDSADGKPVIVVNHNLIYGTNSPQSYWSFNRTENGELIKAAMEGYDGKVLYFCGHSHFGLSDSTIKTIKNVSYINMPLFSEGAYYADNDDGDEAGIGCVLSMYDDSIELSFNSFITGEKCTDFESITISLSETEQDEIIPVVPVVPGILF